MPVTRSETSKVRHMVLPYCIGNGCDIGFGGDKIVKENCKGIDMKTPYGYTGQDKVDIPCDLRKEKLPVADNHFDFVYSSHLVEDFPDTKAILKDFCRVLKSGGNIITAVPDQPIYEAYCKQHGQYLNPHHVHANMGLNFLRNLMNEIAAENKWTIQELFSSNCEIDYNVVLVHKITKQSTV